MSTTYTGTTGSSSKEEKVKDMSRRLQAVRTGKLLITLFLVSIMSLLSLQTSSAESLSKALAQWDPDEIQGRVMEVGSDYIIVQERKILLVDEVYSGREYRTEFLDLTGKPYLKRDLRVGRVVFAKGGLAYDEEIRDNVLVATQIYFLNTAIERDKIQSYEQLVTPAEPW